MTSPRLGFLGTGWIGRHRMAALLESAMIDVAGIVDPIRENAEEAAKLASEAPILEDLDQLLCQDLDGLVIATPSALHARQATTALERGVAVFCQKPLGRNAAEVRAVIDAAKKADRLLGVDFSYRFTQGMQQIYGLLHRGELGRVYAVDLVFHNAYGPDKPWFYDPKQAGGGCVMDLGVHLVDLALWALDFPEVKRVDSNLLAGGAPLVDRLTQVEDYASVTVELATGTILRLTCSWRLQAGCDAVISAAFYGIEGGAVFRNIDGSFYDFVAERFWGTRHAILTEAPDRWGGRAAVHWLHRLTRHRSYDVAAEQIGTVAAVLDRIYRPFELEGCGHP